MCVARQRVEERCEERDAHRKCSTTVINNCNPKNTTTNDTAMMATSFSVRVSLDTARKRTARHNPTIGPIGLTSFAAWHVAPKPIASDGSCPSASHLHRHFPFDSCGVGRSLRSQNPDRGRTAHRGHRWTMRPNQRLRPFQRTVKQHHLHRFSMPKNRRASHGCSPSMGSAPRGTRSN